MLTRAGHIVVISEKEGCLTNEELLESIDIIKPEAVISLLTNKLDKETLENMPSVKIIANYAVGFDNIDVAAAKEKGITVTNTPGVLTDSVAEMTIALILAITKRIVEADTFVRAGSYTGWEPMLLLGSDLRGKTLGILGAGRIGGRVAEVFARGFGMQIIYNDIQQTTDFETQTGAKFYSSLDQILETADIISIHVPLLESTRHLINKEKLALMKNSAYIVNTSRGAIIDEAALAEALEQKTIKGAALDVFEFEPQVTEKLLHLPNVILTPHIASATEETRNKMAEMVARNIIQFLNGETPENVITL
jgi:glyoxylate reductase